MLAGLSHAIKCVLSAHFMQMDARQVPSVDEFDAIGAFYALIMLEFAGIRLGLHYPIGGFWLIVARKIRVRD